MQKPRPRRVIKNQQLRRDAHYLGAWLKKLGYTQETAAESLGWSQSKVSRVANYRSPLEVGDVHHVAQILGRSTWEIIHVDPSEENLVVELPSLLSIATVEQRKQIAEFAEFTVNKPSN